MFVSTFMQVLRQLGREFRVLYLLGARHDLTHMVDLLACIRASFGCDLLYPCIPFLPRNFSRSSLLLFLDFFELALLSFHHFLNEDVQVRSDCLSLRQDLLFCLL